MAHHGNFPRNGPGPKPENLENWGKWARGPIQSPGRPQRHPYGSVLKIRHITEGSDQITGHDKAHQGPCKIVENEKLESDNFRRKFDISETFRMGPRGVPRPRRKCTDLYGTVRKGTDAKKGFPSPFQFFENRGLPTSPARPRQVPNPKVSVVGRVYHFQWTGTKETWPYVWLLRC